jgi:hypothetical protein
MGVNVRSGLRGRQISDTGESGEVVDGRILLLESLVLPRGHFAALGIAVWHLHLDVVGGSPERPAIESWFRGDIMFLGPMGGIGRIAGLLIESNHQLRYRDRRRRQSAWPPRYECGSVRWVWSPGPFRMPEAKPMTPDRG